MVTFYDALKCMRCAPKMEYLTKILANISTDIDLGFLFLTSG